MRLFSCIVNSRVIKVYLSVDTLKSLSIDGSWTKFLVRESNVMKTLDINGPVELKLAAYAFTQKLRSYFKLYPHTLARDICEIAHKAKVSPLEMVGVFEKSLPQLVSDCLAETKTILQKAELVKK